MSISDIEYIKNVVSGQITPHTSNQEIIELVREHMASPRDNTKFQHGQAIFQNVHHIVESMIAPENAPPFPKNLSQNDIRQVQIWLNTIRQSFPAIPPVTENGMLDEQTRTAIRTFQRTFGLFQDGNLNRATWNRMARQVMY